MIKIKKQKQTNKQNMMATYILFFQKITTFLILKQLNHFQHSLSRGSGLISTSIWIQSYKNQKSEKNWRCMLVSDDVAILLLTLFHFYIHSTDPCYSSPCKNGAACSRTSDNDYQCFCNVGWLGDNCDIDSKLPEIFVPFGCASVCVFVLCHLYPL